MLQIIKVKPFHAANLRNSEHFQFNADVINVAKKSGTTLENGVIFKAYEQCYHREDEAFKKITKSPLTVKLQGADNHRDTLYRGLTDTVKGALGHYLPEKREAAGRVQIVIDTYGNLAKKSYSEETAGIYNFIEDLRTKYAADVTALGLTDWVTALGAANNAFNQLMESRDNEVSLRCNLVLKECRLQTDEAYYDFVDVVNATAILDWSGTMEAFINGLNAIIDRYAATLARRQGRKNADEEEDETNEEVEEAGEENNG